MKRGRILTNHQPVTAVRWKGLRPDLDREAERYRIYRLFDAAGALLYIGRSCNPESRRRDHELTAEWGHLVAAMTVDPGEPMTWDEAVAAERAAIAQTKPPHNLEFVTHNPQP